MKKTIENSQFVIAKDLGIDTHVSESIIANQMALVLNERIKTTNRYKKELKMRLNPLIQVLIKAEIEEYDKVFDHNEMECVNVYDEYFKMISTLAKLGIHHSENVTHMLEKFIADPEGMQNFVNS